MTGEKIIIRRGRRYGAKRVDYRRCVALTIVGTTALTAAVTPMTSGPQQHVVKVQQMKRDVARLMPLLVVELVAPKKARFEHEDGDQKTFKALNSYYVGSSKLKVDWSNVDLAQNIRYMWKRKMKAFAVTPAVQKNVNSLVANYEWADHETTTLDHYISSVDHAINGARSHLDYPALCSHFRLSSDRCVRLQYMTGRITGRMMVAYSMTELFPSRDGETNRVMLDVMLRRAGTDYLDAIPALGDGFLSMGPYQFTSYAVRYDASGPSGANIVARYAGKGQGIAGSVMNLHGAAQHRAAFYFATYNLALLLGKSGGHDVLNARQYANLKARSPISERDLTTFMASAHHLPSGARRGMAAWLQQGCTLPLVRYMRGDLASYGAKSASNLKAVS